MTRFNLSEWAVNNRAIAVFFMLVCLIGGLSAYQRLGREEDPDFSIQTMVVQASWPGASVADTLTQLTDRLEKKLEETPNLDYLKSYTKPGQATIFVNLKESTPSDEIEDIWYQVRKKISDIQMTLPKGVVGPFFNDEFGDVFGIVYGITYDGFTPREARDFAETARAEFLRSPGRRQGRDLRRSGREGVPELLAAEARQPRPEPRAGARGGRRAERRGSLRRHQHAA